MKRFPAPAEIVTRLFCTVRSEGSASRRRPEEVNNRRGASSATSATDGPSYSTSVATTCARPPENHKNPQYGTSAAANCDRKQSAAPQPSGGTAVCRGPCSRSAPQREARAAHAEERAGACPVLKHQRMETHSTMDLTT